MLRESQFTFNIDTQGTLQRLSRQIAAMPLGVERAQQRALKKLATWVRRQVLREAAKASGTTQKVLTTLLRYRVTQTESKLAIWLGTNAIKAHHLGTVRWKRSMTGARVGRRGFVSTWSWPNSRRMAGLVVKRTSAARLPVAVVTVPIHDQISNRIAALQPDINARFNTLLRQELNYALTVEASRA